jgi:hypothetical protein
MIAKKLPGRLQLAPSFDLRLLRGGSRPAIGGKAAQQRRGTPDPGEYREAAGAASPSVMRAKF